MSDKIDIARYIHMLARIKENLIEDVELCTKVTGYGNLTVAYMIDRLVADMMLTQTRIKECELSLDSERQENSEYRIIFGGYSPDMLDDEEFEELKVTVAGLVKKWKAKDGEDDG